MAIPHSMNTAERRKALLQARRDVELNMYAIATALGFDADTMDYENPDHLWKDDLGEAEIYSWDIGAQQPYLDLQEISLHFKKIVGKLEGPNRVV
jgi:hypothetical protein|tara:strand:- start:330 stop:614 length:285 start_codon:yes stop_codon:yes gene_type:complete